MKKIRISLYLCIVSFYVFWSISGYGSTANYFATLFCVVLLFLAIKKNKAYVFNSTVLIDKSCLFFLAFFLYHTLTSLININDFKYWAGNIVVYVFVSYFPLFIYRNYEKYYSYKERIKALKVIMFIWNIIVIYSIIYYIFNPGIAREAIVYQEEFDKLFIGGGYPLAYGSCVLGVFIFGLYTKGYFTTKKEKKIAILFVLLSFIHVFLTNSTLTTIWMIVGLFFETIFRKKGKNYFHKKIIMIFIFFGLFILLIFFNTQIGSYIISIGRYDSEATLYQKRIYEIGTIIKGESYTRHTNDRLSRPLMSFEKFVESPIVGVGYKYGYSFALMSENGLGNHSELIDTLAKYGLIGFSLWIMLIITFIKSVQNNLKQTKMSIWWIIMLSMMFFNPFISMPSLVAVFLILPLISKIIKDRGEIVHE